MKVSRRKAAGLIAASALVAMPYVRRARAEDQVLNVYNWADYIGETTIEDFQSATGISVTYDTYTSAEEMEAKMLAGSTGYDVVFMSGSQAAKLHQGEGLPEDSTGASCRAGRISIPRC